MKKGNKAFAKAEYEFAIQHYLKSLENRGPENILTYKIGECYRASNRLPKSLKFYKASLDKGYNNDTLLYFYGKALKANGQYLNAKNVFEKIVTTYKGNDFYKDAKKELNDYKIIADILNGFNEFEIENAKHLNTEEAEYCIIPNGDNLVFSSSRGQGQMHRANGLGFTDLYEYVFDGFNKTSGYMRIFAEAVNEEGVHEACPTISPDGNVMIFAKGNDGTKKGRKSVDLYISYLKNGQWTTPQMLAISDPDANDTSPKWSSDGRSIYFASTRKGGFGGFDLYKASFRDTVFANVRNLGNIINTKGHEMFPHQTDDGRLYFSSDGHTGLGGLDLFVAYKDESRNMKVEDLGLPINSSYDDFGIVYTDSIHGYFCSNRPQGKGDDDIYAFTDKIVHKSNQQYFVYLHLEGLVLEDLDTAAGLPITKAMVNIKDSITGEELFNDSVTFDGMFIADLEQDRIYTMKITSYPDKYFSYNGSYSTYGKGIPDSLITRRVNDVILKDTFYLAKIMLNKEIVMDNIYYDYDKAHIRSDAAKELDKLVQILKDSPHLVIELGSHTDDRGDAAYNMRLSQARAQSAVDYIISKGIDTERIIAKGYGEEDPLIEQAKTEEDHQRNRRTEFKVIKITN